MRAQDMRVRNRIVALALGAGLASPAFATDRFWVAPLIGAWNDSGNWSLSSGGSVGGGLPQQGDRVIFDDRSICILNGTGIALPFFNEVILSGSGSGVTSIQHGSGIMNPTLFVVGENASSCEYISSGSMVAGNIFIGRGANGDGKFELLNLGDCVTNTITVGSNGGVGELTLNGSLFDFGTMNISATFGNPGFGQVSIEGGTVSGTNIDVGQSGRGTLTQTGADVDVSSYRVGIFDSVPPSSSTHTGGTLDVSGFLEIGIGFNGNATVAVDGADVTCSTLYMGEGPDANATLNLSSGSLDATSARIGIEGTATLNQIGGVFTADSVKIAEITGGQEAELICSAGVTSVTGTISVGASNTGNGQFTINGGNVTCAQLDIGAANNTLGEVDMFSGSLDVGTINVGNHDIGTFLQSGGSVTAGSIHVHNTDFGLLRMTATASLAATTFSNEDTVEIFGGVASIGTMTNAPGAEFRLGNSPDVRISSVINNGEFVFASGLVVLSGQVSPPPLNLRLLGSFQNNGSLRSGAGLSGDFSMNLTNEGTVTIPGTADLDVNGFLVNNSIIDVDSEGGFNSAQLQVESASGLTNNAIINLDQGLIRTTNGDFVNASSGDIRGPGTIEGGLTNNGRLSRGGQLLELVIEDGADLGASSVIDIQRYPGAHNSVRIATGDITLGGTLNVDFEFFTPTAGAQYVVLSANAGSVIGQFDTVNITDATAEVIYLPDRVIVSVIGCSDADLASPFGVLDFSDVVAFLTAFGSMDPAADLALPSGVFDFSDVVAFLSAFGAGCP